MYYCDCRYEKGSYSFSKWLFKHSFFSCFVGKKVETFNL